MINLLFSGNGKVFDGILSCLLSIFKRTDTKEPFRVYVFTMNITRVKPEYTAISQEMIDFLNVVAREYNKESEVLRVDVTDLYEKEFAYCPNEGAYCSPYTLLRLFADLVPQMPDKLLYLDVDLLFNRDIRLLYDTDVSEVEYAAARDHYRIFQKKIIEKGLQILENHVTIECKDKVCMARGTLQVVEQAVKEQVILRNPAKYAELPSVQAPEIKT